MKKTIVVLGLVVVALLLLLGIISKSLPKKRVPSSQLPRVDLTNTKGEIVPFDSLHIKGRVIFNYYHSSCELCTAELGEILGYAKANAITVIFASSEPIGEVEKFETLVRSKMGNSETEVYFYKIEPTDASKLLGETIVPQTVTFDDGLKVLQRKKGVISNYFLKKSFE